MKTFVVIKTQFEALHCWPDCDINGVMFLQNTHRHIFHVVMKFLVSHSNRDIEFIHQKRLVEDYIRQHWDRKDLGKTSCEDLAINLFVKFNANFVSVFEDNENGAEAVAEVDV